MESIKFDTMSTLYAHDERHSVLFRRICHPVFTGVIEGINLTWKGRKAIAAKAEGLFRIAHQLNAEFVVIAGMPALIDMGINLSPGRYSGDEDAS